jgi:ubiquitin C-terminal hydrolase
VVGSILISKTKKNRFYLSGYPGGLINYGNNCFANAIVQCLAASTIFIRYIEEHLQNNKLAKILLDLIQSINGQKMTYSDESTVATLIDHMRQPRWLTPFEQQDSHEFLLSLIGSLTNPQVQKPKKFGFAACLDSDDEDAPKSLMITESPLITPHPFQGLQATQLQCMECKHKVKSLRNILERLNSSTLLESNQCVTFRNSVINNSRTTSL